MTPLTQTVLADPARNDGHDANGRPGDCMRTAVASLLDLDPAEVPHFAEYGDDDWWDEMRTWARRRGGEWIYLPLPIPEDWREWWTARRNDFAHVLLSGDSPRGPFKHVVVGTPDLVTVHDVHPSRAGLTALDGLFIYDTGRQA